MKVPKPFLERVIKPNGTPGLRWNLSRGQRRALNSKKRFILVQAGWQAGKTEVGPPWLLREMADRGPGDYLVVSPTFPLMTKKVVPIFIKIFERMLGLGKFVGGKNIFTFNDEGCMYIWGHVPDDPPRVLFGHAGDPDSLESATIKAAWADECGAKGFRLGSYQAILGRLSIYQGRLLMTSRPYDLGWMKELIWDPWEAANRNHPDIEVVNFRSLDNPVFPAAEYYRAKRELPAWQFLMKYEGLFTRPAGLIYSSFKNALAPHGHKIPRFEIPESWPRFLGLDFGGVNTAGIFLAEERREDGKPTGRLIAYREYKAGDKTAADHIFDLTKGEPRTPICAGGSKSEGQWRLEFSRGGTSYGGRVGGLPISGPGKPENEAMVEVGINRVFKEFALDRLYVMDHLAGLLDELASYSRELDDAGNPTTAIDAKASYHHLDALRYIVNYLGRDKQPAGGYKGSVASKGLQNL